MKFLAKNRRLMIVLRHGIPPEPITGRQGTPGLYVNFVDGMATAVAMGSHTKEEITDMILNHPGFGRDFIKASEDGDDPFKNTRSKGEPNHNITEVDFGHFGKKNSAPKDAQSLPPEHREAITNIATAMAKEMVKEMIPQITKEISDKMVSNKEPEKKEPIVSSPIENKTRFECSKGCGKASDTKAGIMAHERHCSIKPDPEMPNANM